MQGTGACRDQRVMPEALELALESLRLELLMVVNHPVWILRTKSSPVPEHYYTLLTPQPPTMLK